MAVISQEIIALLTAASVVLAAVGIILTALAIYATGKQIRVGIERAVKEMGLSIERAVKAIHDDIKYSQEKLGKKAG